MSPLRMIIFSSSQIWGAATGLKCGRFRKPDANRKGKPLINLLEDIRPDEKIATILRVSSFNEEACIFMATKQGVVKKIATKRILAIHVAKGIWALDIDEGDEVVAARLVKRISKSCSLPIMAWLFALTENKVRSMGRMARGVKGVTLRDEKDCIVGCEVVNGEKLSWWFVKMALGNARVSKISVKQTAVE